MELRRPTVLDPAKHDRSGFECGEPLLDDWLQQYASQNRKGNSAATWVIADVDFKVVAYATLSMSSLDRSAAPAVLAKGAPRSVPALLVGRLAVNKAAAGQGVGSQMVFHLLATAAELNIKAACRAVVVNALNRRAYDWWTGFGFAPLDPSDPDNLDLYMLSKDIEKTLQIS